MNNSLIGVEWFALLTALLDGGARFVAAPLHFWISNGCVKSNARAADKTIWPTLNVSAATTDDVYVITLSLL